MGGNAVANFVASRDGLPFVNSWPSQPDSVINLPIGGQIKIGDASNGLCGGMVYVVRDFYDARIPMTTDTTLPAAGSDFYKYIVQRLYDSFDLPGGVLKYFSWMNLPDEDQNLLALTRHSVAWHTIEEEWPQIRADIDAGRLSPLGVVTVHSINPKDLGRNHQVLAYAYDLEGSALTLRVYDPNTDPASGDGVTISLDIGHPSQKTAITHNVGIGDPIRGFFRAAYSPSDPSKVAPAAPPPASPPASPPVS